MPEKEPCDNDNFHLFVSNSPDVVRGIFQFGRLDDNDTHLQIRMLGSITELGDGFFLHGYVNHLRASGTIGKYYIVVNPEDMDFLLEKI